MIRFSGFCDWPDERLHSEGRVHVRLFEGLLLGRIRQLHTLKSV